MGDMGDMYRDWGEWTKEKKQERRENALMWLHDNHLPYQEFNNGLHLKVTINDKKIDFWPTTDRIKVDDKYLYDGMNYLINLKQRINK